MFRLPLDDKVSCHPVFALQGLFDVNPSGCQGIELQGLGYILFHQLAARIIEIDAGYIYCISWIGVVDENRSPDTKRMGPSHKTGRGWDIKCLAFDQLNLSCRP